jgi:flagellar hook-associated protein 1 FlgK
MADLLSIGTSGVFASSLLLETAGNNIANVNTPGYVRERVQIAASQYGGIGNTDVERVVSEFAQRQMRRDTASHSYYEQFVTEAVRVDTLFAGTANSVATAMDGFFQRIQSASDSPSSIAARQLIISEAEGLLGTFQTLNGLVLDQGSTINEQLDIFTNETNNLVQNIAKLNKSISSGTTDSTRNPNALLSERDESLRQLAELVEISTLDGSNGEKLVFLNTGESLVLKEGDFNLLSVNGDPDPNRKDLNLSLSTNSSLIVGMDANKVGGKIGGLLTFRQDVLEPTQNRLGQIALALADAFNEQNKLGMDADGEIGSDIFTLPTVSASKYASNTGAAAVAVTASVEPGKGSELSSSDYLITFNAGAFTFVALDEKGAQVTSTSFTQAIAAYPATFDSTNIGANNIFGLQLSFNQAPANGDKFLLKPSSTAASTVSLLSVRPEDIALAAPIRTEANLTNIGNAIISEGVVTDTSATSDFSTGTLGTDPMYVKYIGGNQFELHNVNPLPLPSAGAAVATTAVMAAGQFNDVMASAGLTAYGYDFNIVGTPTTNDVYTIEFNTRGFNDNRNGLKLSELQSNELMRKNVETTVAADNTLTFHEAYARVVSQVGEKTSQAVTSETAFEALLDQSSAWHESISGVNLDEEAANLVKFQQAYSAAAQIISVAQSTFQTLLSAVR